MMFEQMLERLNLYLTENTPYDLKIVQDSTKSQVCMLNLIYNKSTVAQFKCQKHGNVYSFDDNRMLTKSIIKKFDDVDDKVLNEMLYEHRQNHVYTAMVNQHLIMNFDNLPVDKIVESFRAMMFLGRQWYQVILVRWHQYRHYQTMTIKMPNDIYIEHFNQDKYYQFDFGDGQLAYSVHGRLLRKTKGINEYKLALLSEHTPVKVLGHTVINVADELDY